MELAAPPAMNATDAVIRASGLVREYGPVVAVNGIDLSLGEGEFLAIFGPNGAGKSSLLGMLGGALRPTRGTVSIRGEPLDFSVEEWRSKIGVLSHDGFLYAHLTAEENLRFYGSLFGLEDLDRRVPDRLERVGLTDRATFEVRRLSHGMRQRLALARALLHDPRVLVLDDATSAIDVRVEEKIHEALRAATVDRTVIVIAHRLSTIALADRVVLLDGGRVAAAGTHDELLATEPRYRRLLEHLEEVD